MFPVGSLPALALAELKIPGKGLLNKIFLLVLSGVGFGFLGGFFVFCFFSFHQEDRGRGRRNILPSAFQRGVAICTKAKVLCGGRGSAASSLKGTLFRSNPRTAAPRALHIYQINAVQVDNSNFFLMIPSE